MTDQSVIARSGNDSVRVLADPWRIGATDDGTELPFHEPPFPKGSYATGAQIVDGLTLRQKRTLTAAHEAGHAVMFYLFGMPIVEVSLYPDDPRSPGPDLAPGHGHTMLADDKPRLHVPHIVGAYLAGQVAGEMWLEHAGLITPLRRFLAQRFAGSDHEAILRIDAELPVAYLYGDATPPPGWSGDVVNVDEVIEATRQRLEAAWTAVSALTNFLDQHSYADSQALNTIFEDAFLVTLIPEPEECHGFRDN